MRLATQANHFFVTSALAFLRRRLTGQYDVDEFGFDHELNDNVIQPLLQPLYRDWFRVEVTGAKNVPLDRAGLVVANHSGTIALDATQAPVQLGAPINGVYTFRYFTTGTLHDADVTLNFIGGSFTFVSSSGVKEIAAFGGSVDELVPPAVARRLKELFPHGMGGAPLNAQE